jgi:large subunit ribosomal protein L14
MLLPYSNINIYDNSRASVVSCISLLRNTKKSGATIGQVFICSIKKVNLKNKNLKLKKGSICSVLFIKMNRNLKRYGLVYLKSNLNGGILINSDNLPVASRLFGVIYKEVKDLNFLKVALLAEFLV